MKIIKHHILGILAIMMVPVVSCSKADTLEGTKWLGAKNGNTIEITFGKDDFKMKDSGYSATFAGSYVYQPPKVTFIITKDIHQDGTETSDGGSFTADVDGKVMTVDYGNGLFISFIKQ